VKKFLYVNPAIVIVIFIFFGFGAVIINTAIYLVEDVIEWIKIVITVVFNSMTVIVIYFYALDRVVVVDDKGIEARSRFFKTSQQLNWDEIVEVGLVYYSPYTMAGTAKLICFSSEANLTQKQILRLSDNCIYIKYRRGLVPFLRTYWAGEIKGLEK